MRLSLQARVAVVVTLIIVLISLITTYLFISAYTQSRERNRVMRGETLAYTLSKAAEEGLLREDLDLIRKASYVIQAPDVMLVQVYSSIWNCVDAYPIDSLNDPPHPAAAEHYKTSLEQVNFILGDRYDFYAPILFRPYKADKPIAIGFVRISLSSASLIREIRRIVVTNTLVSLAVTVLAIILITLVLRRLVVRPVLGLHDDVTAFRKGSLPEALTLPTSAPGELKDLEREFHDLFRDVRDKEQMLVESHRRIRSLFERVEHAIFRLDRNGAIIEANDHFRTLFGGAQTLCEILAGDDSARDCLSAAAGEQVLHRETGAVGENGAELAISLSLYPERDSTGAVVGYDGYLINVTEKKRFEERLVRAQKMEAIGTLAGGLAHDFNNILTAILGYSSILLKKFPADEPTHKSVSIIHAAAQRGADLGRKLLSITRKEQVELKPVDLNDVVRASLELLQRSLPKEIEIVTRLADGLPPTKADASQLQQVIINLAVNARDAMHQGGRLTIETSLARANAPSGPEGSGLVNDMLRLSIADNGTGMDADTKMRIFDPFFTTKDTGKGTGLGLYIVHSIVHGHGGHINLYSEPGLGTQFTIYLPVVAAGSVPAVLRPAVEVRGSGTILVIDDEAHVREMCRDMLGSLGYAVITAENGPAGIETYRERRREIDLVILDMIMPKMGGAEVFAGLKTVDPSVRVLLYSGYSSNGLAAIEELRKRGAAGFIQKPFSAQDISVAIRDALS